MGLMANNNPTRTRARVRFLQKQGGASKRTTYVYAGQQLRSGVHHPFEEARLSVLAPEKDTSCYPVGLQPLPLTATSLSGEPARDAAEPSAPVRAPTGVNEEAFARLVERRKRGIATDVLAIDKAANNTSVVFMLEWRGWRLLFTGDAEEASWVTMEKLERGLKPVHFLKVGHHGSINGTPHDSILETILPAKPLDSRKRVALVSTCYGTIYGDVPNQAVLDRLGENRVSLRSTAKVPRGEAVEESFSG